MNERYHMRGIQTISNLLRVTTTDIVHNIRGAHAEGTISPSDPDKNHCSIIQK